MHIHTASHLDRLAPVLQQHLHEEMAGVGDPFYKPLILVPNLARQTFVKLALARRTGDSENDRRIAVNLDLHFLEEGLWHILARALEGEGTRTQRLARESVQAMLLGIFLGPEMEMTELAMARDYISGHDEGKARRCWQFADMLSRLFRDYENHAPHYPRRWLAEKGGAYAHPGEECQAALYRLIFAPDGMRDRMLRDDNREGNGYQKLLLRELCDRACDGMSGQDCRPVHIFGISTLSRLQREIVTLLSESRPVHIYWQDPACEAGALENTEELLPHWSPPATRSQGMADNGVNVTLAEVATENDTDEKLLQIQRRFMLADGGQEAVCTAIPQNIQFAAAQDIYREVETARAWLTAQLHRDPQLRPSDMALLVSDMEIYKPVIEAVFGRKPYRFGYSLADSRAGEESAYAEGVAGILALAEGFTRRQVFAVLRNPCVQAAIDATTSEVEVWLKWAEELNIFRAYDEAEKYTGCDLADMEHTPVHTWLQGLRRLRLGRIMTGGLDSEDDAPPPFAGLPPFADADSEDDNSLGRFCLAVERLHNLSIELSSPPRTGSEWARVLAGSFDLILHVPEDRAFEGEVARAFRESLGELARFDTISGQDGPLLEVGLVREWLSDRLLGLSARRGEPMLGGVRVAQLGQDVPLPADVVCLLGLGEGCLGSGGGSNSFDLLDVDTDGHAPRSGSRLTPAESSRVAFTQAFLQTRKKFLISYVLRDLQKDCYYEPSSVVNEWTSWLNGRVVLPEGKKFVPLTIPLNPGDENYFLQHGDGGEVQNELFFIENEKDRQAGLLQLSGDDSLPENIREAVNRELEQTNPEQGDQQSAAADTGNAPSHALPDRIGLDLLRRFLCNPAIARARLHLGIYLAEEEDAALVEEEPLKEGPFFFKCEVLRKAMDNFLLTARSEPGKATPAMVAEDIKNLCHCRTPWGDLPEGAFARRFVNILASSLDDLFSTKKKNPPQSSLQDLLSEIGGLQLYTNLPCAVGSSGTEKEPRPILVNAGEMGEVTLEGTVDYLFVDGRASRASAVRLMPHMSAEMKFLSYHSLEPFLWFMAALAGGQRVEDRDGTEVEVAVQGFDIHLVCRDSVVSMVYPPVAPGMARNYLECLVSQLFAPACSEHLPFDLVVHNKAPDLIKATPEEYAEKLQELMDDADDGKSRGNQAEADYLSLLAPQITPDAQALARRRLGLYLLPPTALVQYHAALAAREKYLADQEKFDNEVAKRAEKGLGLDSKLEKKKVKLAVAKEKTAAELQAAEDLQNGFMDLLGEWLGMEVQDG